VTDNVRVALAEDIGSGDLTAALVPPDETVRARVITRQETVVCGRPWFDEVYRQIDPAIKPIWHTQEGQKAMAGSVLVEVLGPARALLSAERTALNFLQLLCAVATRTHAFVEAVVGTGVRILDTRKTVPGLRAAQKYAVRVGGGSNHRMGLYDGILIKENHIHAVGGIRAALSQTQRMTQAATFIMIEVETIDQLREALDAGAHLIMLDNMTPDTIRTAVSMAAGRAELEVSGGVTLDTVRALANTGIDRISIGSLTKDIQAIDLSMRFE